MNLDRRPSPEAEPVTLDHYDRSPRERVRGEEIPTTAVECPECYGVMMTPYSKIKCGFCGTWGEVPEGER